MAGVITHMVIAREIIKLLPEGTIQEDGLFYLGNLAPDAIHAREGYIRDFKKHTHFRDNIRDMDFLLEENQIAYRKRIQEFIATHRDRKDGLYDLYRGYVAHILSDELFFRTVRAEFCEVMDKLNIAQNDPRFFDYIIRDMNRNDMLLVKRYNDMEEVKRQIEQVPIHPIDNLLSHQEMKDSMNWLIRRHFYEEDELIPPVYISYDRTVTFIQSAANDIITKMSDKDSPISMF
jgi:hypothetical protein